MPLAHIPHGDNGPPLLILHGLFGSGRNWGAIAKRLARSYRVFALDLPNHGRSPWVDGVMNYPFMADQVAAFMDAHDLPSATVMGHSMGGKTAMQLALAHGDRVDALVVVDIAPVTYTGREHLAYIRAMQGADVASATRRSEVEDQLVDAIPTEAVRKFMMQNLVSAEDGPGLRWQINLEGLAASLEAIMDFPLEPEMEPYGGPSFFLAGGASDYVLPEHEPAIARLFPDHALHRLEGCGHWLHAEAPALFTEHLLDFLAGVAPS